MRREAEPEKARADFGGDLAHLFEVQVYFRAGFVNGLERRAGQFELPAGFEADGAAVLRKADDRLALFHGRPAETLHAFQHGVDAVRALVGQGRKIGNAEAEFLVLGADTPCALGLAAYLKVLDQLMAMFNRPAALLRHGHGGGSGMLLPMT